MKIYIVVVEENRGFEVTKDDMEKALQELSVPECGVVAVKELQ